jgi:hypothetical protein
VCALSLSEVFDRCTSGDLVASMTELASLSLSLCLNLDGMGGSDDSLQLDQN